MLARLIKSLLPDPNRARREVDILYREARGLWETRQWPQAQARVEQALALSPDLPALHFLLGNILADAGQSAAAQHALARCIACKPPQFIHLGARSLHALLGARERLARGDAPPLLALGNVLGEHASPPMVSVIVCSINPERRAHTEQMYRRLLAELPHEVIVISDGQSMCEGYNRGLRQARGELVVFSHDDVIIHSPDFAARLVRQLQRHDVIGLAGTTQLRYGSWFSPDGALFGQVGGLTGNNQLQALIYDITGSATPDIQAIDGYFMAARRNVALQLGFDEATFGHWHLYDIDFSWRAHKAGMRCAVANDILAVHLSPGHFDSVWQAQVDLFLQKHQRAKPPAGYRNFARPLDAIAINTVEEWRWLNALMIEDVESGRWKLPYYR
jgi:tetratricopeptide (TPR) repeat protein